MIECLRLVKMQITADGLKEEGVGSYSPADYNPREDLQPGDRRFEKIKRSLAELNDFGILVVNQRTMRLISGHQRLKVMRTLGWLRADVKVFDVDEEMEKAMNIAANNDEIAGDWAMPRLGALLATMDDAHRILTGFDEDQIESIIAGMEVVEPEVLDPGKPTRSRVDWRGFMVWQATTQVYLFLMNGIHYLVPFYNIDAGNKKQRNLKGPNSLLFIDSGLLGGVHKEGIKFVERQGDIIEVARKYGADWTAMMDIPMIPDVVETLRISYSKAADIHLQNAKQFSKERVSGRKVYVVQGRT